MKKELIWCRKCGKYAIKPCQLTSDDACPSCGSWDLYDIVADPAAENYFCNEDRQIYSIEDLKAGYEENKGNPYFCEADINSFEEFIETEMDMGGQLARAEFTGEF